MGSLNRTANVKARRLSAFCAFAAFALCAVSDASADDSTLFLLKQCEGQEPPGDPTGGVLACANYFDGLLSMHQMMVGGGKGTPVFCLPSDGLTLEEVVRVFIKFADDNPTALHEPKNVGALVALEQAYPCQ